MSNRVQTKHDTTRSWPGLLHHKWEIRQWLFKHFLQQKSDWPNIPFHIKYKITRCSFTSHVDGCRLPVARNQPRCLHFTRALDRRNNRDLKTHSETLARTAGDIQCDSGLKGMAFYLMIDLTSVVSWLENKWLLSDNCSFPCSLRCSQSLCPFLKPLIHRGQKWENEGTLAHAYG